MTLIDRVREHVAEHGRGMMLDLAFAVIWVTVVTVLFRFVEAPRTVYYGFMALGVVAYFGFFWSLEAAKENQ